MGRGSSSATKSIGDVKYKKTKRWRGGDAGERKRRTSPSAKTKKKWAS